MQPLNEISVVIPMHNAESTIGRCLEAVFSRLKNLREVIVIDDCSIDRSVEIARGFPCRLLRLNKQSFAAGARNLGVREAKGRFIFFIDSDAVLKKDVSQKIAQYIKVEEGVIALVGMFSQEHPNRNFVSQYKNLYTCYKYHILPDFISSLNTAITAIDRDSFWKVGGLDEQSRVEDVELGEKIVRMGYRIRLDKDMEVVHLKGFTLKQMLINDFRKTRALTAHFRRIRDKKRIFRERVINDISLPLFLSVLSGGGVLPALGLGLFFRPVLVMAAVLWLIFVSVNMRFWRYLAGLKGRRFAFFSFFLTWLDMNCVALAIFTVLIKPKTRLSFF